jgi:CRP/FNR family transcriptional regulator, anaerobic regulatory protein
MGQNLFDVLTLNGTYPVRPELKNKIISIVEEKTYKRNSLLLKAGQVNDRIWFVQSGLLRGYSVYKDSDKWVDATYWFRGEGEFAVSIPSFYEQEISPEDIEAFEDTEVLFISFEQYKSLGFEFLEWNFIRAEFLEKYLVEENRQNRAQKKRTAEQRFQWLLDKKPNLLNRVADKYLASYLGITPETFSNVKTRSFLNANGTSVKH